MGSSWTKLMMVGAGALALSFCCQSVFADLLFEASLRDGDYGGGVAVDTFPPDHGGSPHVLGIVDSPEGVSFTPTESDGASNGLINWVIPSGKRLSFRQSGTISMWIKVDRDAHSAMDYWGHLWCENYGFGGLGNGQASFASGTGHVANGPGPEDDQFYIDWQVLHPGPYPQWFYVQPRAYLDYGRWYNIGFAWGGPDSDYEVWVCGSQVVAWNLPAGYSLPWGVTWAPSGTNWGLGDNHRRGLDRYGTSVGITYADLRIWDEYRDYGDTGACPDHLVVDIDIKPGSFPNPVNPKSRGVIPVAILTTDDFDATMVDVSTVAFGPDGAAEVHGQGHFEDVDEDGDIDMVLHFRTRETGIAKGDTEAWLTGETLDEIPILGVDSIKTVGGSG